MGLDIDLVKFNKEFFDSHLNEHDCVDYDCVYDVNIKELYCWRKKYIIRELLGRDNEFKGNCCYQPLSKIDLESILAKIKEIDWSDPESTKQGMHYDPNLISDFEKLLVTTLSETNFETDQVAYTWIP